MARYNVIINVCFEGELEADSEAHAEELAWTAWGTDMDAQLTYSMVDSIDVEQVEEEEN